MADIVFKISCQRLPVDHAHALSAAITQHVPWLRDCPGAGIHPVHLAGSQNGWERPSRDGGGDLILSRRTRLIIRSERKDVDRLISDLSGQSIDVSNCPLHILSGRSRDLTAQATVFARYVHFTHLTDTDLDENEFVSAVMNWCVALGFKPTKLLAGKMNTMLTDDTTLVTRSVMLADVPDEHSLKLQEVGIGDRRLTGCGIVLPHKDTNPVNAGAE